MKKLLQVLLQQAYSTPHHVLLHQDMEVLQSPQPEKEDAFLGSTCDTAHNACDLTISHKAVDWDTDMMFFIESSRVAALTHSHSHYCCQDESLL